MTDRKFKSSVFPDDLIGMQETTAPTIEIALREITVVEGFNPRRLLSSDAFSDAALSDLVESIREFGVLQPLLVRDTEGKFVLIAGERRYRAAAQAGLKKVPVRVLHVDDQRAFEIAIIENAHRKDLDLVTETLVGFELLSSRLHMTVPEVVTHLNLLRNNRVNDDHNVEHLLRSVYGTGVFTWATRRAKILKMTPQEQAAVRDGRIEGTACAELTRLPSGPDRDRLLQKAIDEQLSGPQIAALVRALLTKVDQGPSLSSRVKTVQNALGKVSALKGDRAKRAEQLIAQLEEQLGELLRS